MVLSGIFLIWMREVLFVKCSVRLINEPRRDYGQNGDFWDLPVKARLRLWAKSRFVSVYPKNGMKFAIDCESSCLLV